MPKPQQRERPGPRLYLVTPVIEDAVAFARELAPVLKAADVAAVLLRLKASDERALINRVKALTPAVQDFGAALLLDGHAELVARGGADGAHLTGNGECPAVSARLKPARTAGCGGLATRHDAMTAAESGADYVMFGEPMDGQRPAFDAIIERVAWWAEVFEIPCVGYAASLDEIGALARAGADFVAAGDCIWDAPRGAAAALGEATERLSKMAIAE